MDAKHDKSAMLASAGRAPERNAEATRHRILLCATSEFAAKGYAGARMSSIVSAAGVNISLAYHYFGGKESLFLHVMEKAYKTIRRFHREIELKGKPPEAAMEELVRSTFQIFLDFPEVIGLLNAENVHKAQFIRKSNEIMGMYNPLLEAIDEILKRGSEMGVFHNDVDPVDLFITINGLGYFYLSNQYTLSYILHQNLADPERIRQRENHIVKVVLRYLSRSSLYEPQRLEAPET
jgi:TetR/AcrR family transcriptional regulator